MGMDVLRLVDSLGHIGGTGCLAGRQLPSLLPPLVLGSNRQCTALVPTVPTGPATHNTHTVHEHHTFNKAWPCMYMYMFLNER